MSELVVIDKHYHGKFSTQRRETRQNWLLDRFCRTKGFTRAKLDKHPQFDDVMALLAFDGWESEMTHKDLQIWTHAWQWIYVKEFALTEYLRERLLSIVDGIEFRQLRREQQRSRRKSMRSGLHT